MQTGQPRGWFIALDSSFPWPTPSLLFRILFKPADYFKREGEGFSGPRLAPLPLAEELSFQNHDSGQLPAEGELVLIFKKRLEVCVCVWSCAVAYLGPHVVCLCVDFYWLNGGPPQRPPKDPVSRAGLAVHRAVVFNNYWLCKYLWASWGEDCDDYCLNYSAQFPWWWVDFLLLFSSSRSNLLFSTIHISYAT